jgi:hypothetical protein
MYFICILSVLNCSNNTIYVIMSGFVYFFKHNNVDAVKIGFTSSDDLTDRFKSFSTSSPYGAKILGFIKSDKPRELESIIHKELDSHRLNGEFFEISEERVNHVISLHSKSNGIKIEALVKIENYVQSLSEIDRHLILGKISRYFDSLVLQDKKTRTLDGDEEYFLNKYKQNGVCIVKKTCTQIQSEYFPNKSLRKVGLFLKTSGFMQKLEQIETSGSNSKSRVYYLFT